MEALLYKLRGCHDLEAEEVIVVEKWKVASFKQGDERG